MDLIQLFFPITIGACVVGVMVYLVMDKKQTPKLTVKNDPNSYENQLKRCDEEREKFDWKEYKGIKYFVYPFHKNKLTLLVIKYGMQTQGMAWHIIDDLTKDFKFRPAKPTGIHYNHCDGVSITKEQTDDLWNRLKMEQYKKPKK